jgi:hypothetical protein
MPRRDQWVEQAGFFGSGFLAVVIPGADTVPHGELNLSTIDGLALPTNHVVVACDRREPRKII